MANQSKNSATYTNLLKTDELTTTSVLAGDTRTFNDPITPAKTVGELTFDELGSGRSWSNNSKNNASFSNQTKN